MAYDERLAARIRNVLADTNGVSERKMFGGLAVLLDGKMACGVVGDKLMLRLGRECAEDALRRPNVRPMDFTGRPMRGMVYVESAGLRGVALRRWVERAVAYAGSLPPRRAA